MVSTVVCSLEKLGDDELASASWDGKIKRDQ
jgi:hypothetical protein